MGIVQFEPRAENLKPSAPQRSQQRPQGGNAEEGISDAFLKRVAQRGRCRLLYLFGVKHVLKEDTDQREREREPLSAKGLMSVHYNTDLNIDETWQCTRMS